MNFANTYCPGCGGDGSNDNSRTLCGRCYGIGVLIDLCKPAVGETIAPLTSEGTTLRSEAFLDGFTVRCPRHGLVVCRSLYEGVAALTCGCRFTETAPPACWKPGAGQAFVYTAGTPSPSAT